MNSNGVLFSGLASAGADSEESQSKAVRLEGRWLLVARVLWTGIVLTALFFFFTGLQRSFQIASTLSPGTTAFLAQAGIPLRLPATYLVVLDTATVALFGFVAAWIFTRRPDDLMAIITSVMLVLTAMLYTAPAYEARAPIWLVACGAALAELSQFAFLLMFPDGRFVPKRSWIVLPPLLVWRLGIWGLLYIPNVFALERTGDNYPYLPQQLFDLVMVLAVYGFGIWAQVYRYRHVSNPAQRQQVKWLVWGVSVVVLVVGLYVIALNVVPTLSATADNTVLLRLAGRTIRQLALSVIPITLLYSILRLRLWGIDLLINRTLVYVPLTAILGTIMALTIATIQNLFIALTGEQSDVAVVLTTLVVAVAFEPIKKWLQGVVDKTFKQVADPIKEIRAFEEQVQSVVRIIDANRLLRGLLETSVRAFGADGGAVYLAEDDHAVEVYKTGQWLGPAAVQVGIEWQDEVRVGWMLLGRRRSGAPYTKQQREQLQQIAYDVAFAVLLARSMAGHVAQASRKATVEGGHVELEPGPPHEP